jgi:hypothetical protein
MFKSSKEAKEYWYRRLGGWEGRMLGALSVLAALLVIGGAVLGIGQMVWTHRDMSSLAYMLFDILPACTAAIGAFVMARSGWLDVRDPRAPRKSMIERPRRHREPGRRGEAAREALNYVIPGAFIGAVLGWVAAWVITIAVSLLLAVIRLVGH